MARSRGCAFHQDFTQAKFGRDSLLAVSLAASSRRVERATGRLTGHYGETLLNPRPPVAKDAARVGRLKASTVSC